MREREARCHLTLLIHVHVLAQSEQSVASSTPPLGLRLRAVYDEDGLDNDGDARPGLFTALQLCLGCLAFSVGLRSSHALGLPACVLRPGELVYAQGDIVVVTKRGASGEEGWSGYLEHNPGAGTGRFLRRYMEVVEDLSGDHYRTRCLVPAVLVADHRPRTRARLTVSLLSWLYDRPRRPRGLEGRVSE